MKIFLLNPPTRRVVKKTDIPEYQHIGLGYLVSCVEKSGYPVKVVDAKLNRLGIAGAIKEINDYSPDILGITAMTQEVDIAAQIAREYKKTNPDVKIVLGGVHLTALPQDTLRQYPQIDLGIAGEGEISFVKLIKAIEVGLEDFSTISGVVFRQNNSIKYTPYERINDVDSLPFPGWQHFSKAKVYNIITARGCPFSCIFCMQAMGRVVRKRSCESVVEEIERVVRERPPARFAFYDETFTIDRQRVHTLCELLINNALNKRIKWTVTTRVDVVDKDVLTKMRQAGCDHIEFVVESGSDIVLERIKKTITKEKARRAVALSKELKFHTECAFILGHPGENMQTALETVYFAAELNPDIVQLGIMVPYPGTEIRRMALQGEGGYSLLSNEWSNYNNQIGYALELEELSRADLERLQLIGYLRLFLSNRRYFEFIKFMFKFKREMLAYLRNVFKKRKKIRRSKIPLYSVIRFALSKSLKEIIN